MGERTHKTIIDLSLLLDGRTDESTGGTRPPVVDARRVRFVAGSPIGPHDRSVLCESADNREAMYDDILVPTDESEPMAEVIERAVDLANRYDATVHALFVVNSDPLGPSTSR